MKTIAIVDDDLPISNMLAELLQKAGYAVLQAYSGTEALYLLSQHRPDLIVLDLMLPGRSGEEILPEMAGIPVIVLSAKVDTQDKVRLLLGGAADYMTKPFGVMELISRVKAMLRRANLSVETSLEFEGIVLNDAKHKVTVDGKQCDLTYKEFELLKYLMQNSGIVLQRGRILDRVWGIDYEGESRTLDMHIKTLRKKLGDKGALVQTVRNVGYTLNYKKEK